MALLGLEGALKHYYYYLCTSTHILRLPSSAFQQDKLGVSTGGVRLYTPDARGEPQVYYLGQVYPPSSFYKPARQVRMGSLHSNIE